MAKIQLYPQAYTLATLKEAFKWLQTQPTSIRELAQSPDDAVSLFKQQSRVQRERKSDNFKEELKDLSRGLQNFDSGRSSVPNTMNVSIKEPATSTETHVPASSPSLNSEDVQLPPLPPPSRSVQGLSMDEDKPSYQNPALQALQNQKISSSPESFSPQELARGQSLPNHQEATGSSPRGLDSVLLDEKTQVSLHIAKERLNLGSSQEALRVLVALGIERLKEVFPKT